jgi:Ni,Fe-hydrogenase III component G
MKKDFLIVFALMFGGFVAAELLAGCSQVPSTVSRSTAQDFVEHMTYFKDSRTQLCFATVASRKTGETDQSGFTITYVPCTPEVLAVIK